MIDKGPRANGDCYDYTLTKRSVRCSAESLRRCKLHKRDDDVNVTDEIHVGEKHSIQERGVSQSNSTPSDGTKSGGYKRRGRSRDTTQKSKRKG